MESQYEFAAPVRQVPQAGTRPDKSPHLVQSMSSTSLTLSVSFRRGPAFRRHPSVQGIASYSVSLSEELLRIRNMAEGFRTHLAGYVDPIGRFVLPLSETYYERIEQELEEYGTYRKGYARLLTGLRDSGKVCVGTRRR